MNDTYHVTPNNDLKPHNTDSNYCACLPRIETVENGGKIVIHNAYDRREFEEAAEQSQGH